MKKVYTIICLVLVVVSAGLGVGCFVLNNENNFYRQNIDSTFQYNYSQLNNDLMHMALNPDMGEEEKAFCMERVTKTGAIIGTLVNLTSYRDNKVLCDMIMLLDQASGSDALFTINMTKDINDNLTHLMLEQFDNEELCKKTYEMIKSGIKKIR